MVPARAGRVWSRSWLLPLLSAGVGCLQLEQESGPSPADLPAEPAPLPAEPPVVEVSSRQLRGDNMSGSNLGGSNLGGVNLGGSNLGGVNLGGSNLGGVNLGGNNLGGSNLGGSNLGGVNLGGSNLGGANLGGVNLGGSNLGGSNLGGSNLGGNNLLGTNLGGSNLGGSNTGLNIHALPTSMTGMLYSGEDLWLPKTGQCVVMGIGSTAFAKLLGQQSTNAKLSVALGKLPWGLATASGGPVALSTWEAVIWGDRTYCTFLLVAPNEASWPGVAGFIKAVFRWHAPPTQTVEISGIEASAAVDPTVSTAVLSYTGMMNAAAKWREGRIDARSLVAGELAFISATTNNQSVRVDFSSWVNDTTNNGLVLGTVDTVLRPMYAESVYYAYENEDGTLGVAITRGMLTQGVFAYAGNGPSEIYSASDVDVRYSYEGYLDGLSPKPIPTRCAAALFLTSQYGEPTPPGKCDSGLAWSAVGPPIYKSWATVPGTLGPLNATMYLPKDGASPLTRDGRRVLAETYIHMWEPNHYVNAGVIGTGPGGDRSELGVAVSTATSCATNQTARQAFDNDAATKWCASGVPSSSSPRSVMYMWGAALAVTSYAITSAADTAARDPRSWTFQGCAGTCTAGSDTGWVTLDTRTSQAFASRSLARSFAFSNGTAYPQYRLRVTANNGDSASLQIGEVQLFASGGAIVPLAGTDLTENGSVSWTGPPCTTADNANRAFDNLRTSAGNTKWCVMSAYAMGPTAIMYSWPAASHRVTSYAITSAADGPDWDPKAWSLQGCAGECFVGADDGWVTLDSRSSQVFTGRLQTKTYAVANGVAYPRYRLRFTASATSLVQLQVSEIQLYNTASACVPESNAAFCARLGKTCGTVTDGDNCGVTRTVSSCGSCGSPQTCGGGGTANVCGGGAACTFTVSQNTYDGPSYWGSVTFTNTGPAPASNYRVEFDVPVGMSCTNDAVPSGARLSPLTGTGLSARTVSNHCVFTWTGVSPLAPGSSKTFNYSANRTTTFNARTSTIVRDAICNP